MAKDDFGMDFHFDDDDFDPKAFLDGEDGADIDLSEFDDVPSGGDKLDETVADGYDDELDLSGLGLDEDSDETVDELDLDDILSPKAVRRNLRSMTISAPTSRRTTRTLMGRNFWTTRTIRRRPHRRMIPTSSPRPRMTPISMTSRRMKTTTRMRKSRTSLPAAGRKSLKRHPNRPASASQRSRRKRSPTSSPSCMTFTLLP